MTLSVSDHRQLLMCVIIICVCKGNKIQLNATFSELFLEMSFPSRRE